MFLLMFGFEEKDERISIIFADFWIFGGFLKYKNSKLVLFSPRLGTRVSFLSLLCSVLFPKNFFQMFVALKLDEKVGFCYHCDKPNEPIVKWATEKAINHLTK